MSIPISSSVRSNLGALQEKAGQFAEGAERLASGKAVRRALDNPTNYFAATGLSDRATRLGERLDALGQVNQLLEVSTRGLSSLGRLTAGMKGVVNTALGTTDAKVRENLARQFNELLVQAHTVATDASYQGENLLRGGTEKVVQFGESSGQSVLSIAGLDIRAASDSLDEEGNLRVYPTQELDQADPTLVVIEDTNEYDPRSPVTIPEGVELLETSLDGIGSMEEGIAELQALVAEAKANPDPAAREALGRQFNEGLNELSETGRVANSGGNNLLWWNNTVDVRLSEGSQMELSGFFIRTAGDPIAGNLRSVNYMIEDYGEDVFIRDSDNNLVAGRAAIILGGNPIISPIHPPGDVNYYIDYGVAGSQIGPNPVDGSVDWKGTDYEAVLDAVAHQLDTYDSVLGEQKNRYEWQLADLRNRMPGLDRNPKFASFGVTDEEGITYGVQSARIGEGEAAGALKWHEDNYQEVLGVLVQQIEAVEGVLDREAGRLVQSLSTVSLRETFTRKQAHILEEGEDKLVLADLNEEGAKLLAAQTGSRLATQSLALVSREGQALLSLLR